MRPLAAALFCVALGASACRSTTSYDHQGPVGVRNMWAGENIRQASLREAILSQSTLYPFHFVTGTADFNQLGWRDMEVLAAHFVASGGTLGVRQGDADDDLYAERLHTVQTTLAAAGVEPGRVRVLDALPGGAGTTSEQQLEVLERAAQPLQTHDVGTGAAGTSTQSGTSAGSLR